jgi:hypothetical protein
VTNLNFKLCEQLHEVSCYLEHLDYDDSESEEVLRVKLVLVTAVFRQMHTVTASLKQPQADNVEGLQVQVGTTTVTI